MKKKELIYYFGKVQLSVDETDGADISEVCVENYLLLKKFTFSLPGLVEIVDSTHNHVFFLISQLHQLYSFNLNSNRVSVMNLDERNIEGIGFSNTLCPVKVEQFNLESALEVPELMHLNGMEDLQPIDARVSSSAPLMLISCTDSSCYLVVNSDDGPSLNRVFSENRNINVEVLQIGSKDKVCEMSSGKDHVLLLSVAGEVYSFGTGSRGELGHGSLQNESFPVLLDSLQPLRIVQISCGSWYSVALTDGGDVYVWGWNRCGQFGNADPCVIDTPYPLDLEDAFKSILAFRDGLILKKMDGALVVFGSFEFSCQ